MTTTEPPDLVELQRRHPTDAGGVPSMTSQVDLIGWSDCDAVALVDGVRCRIRQNTTETRWLCDAHPKQWCDHLDALNAAQPFDPAKRNHSNKTARRRLQHAHQGTR